MLALIPFLTGKEDTYAGGSCIFAQHALHCDMPAYARSFSRQPPTPHPCVTPPSRRGILSRPALDYFTWRAGKSCWRGTTVGGRTHYAGEHAYPHQLVDRRGCCG